MARKSTISKNPLSDVKPRPRAAPAADTAATAPADKPARRSAAATASPGRKLAAEEPPRRAHSGRWQEQVRAYARWAVPTRITLIAGDFGKGAAVIQPDVRDGSPTLMCPNGQPLRLVETVADIELQSETRERRALRFFGWTLAGGVVFGPIGAVIGALYGAAAQPVIQFAAHCRDGRKFMATSDRRSYQALRAALF